MTSARYRRFFSDETCCKNFSWIQVEIPEDIVSSVLGALVLGGDTACQHAYEVARDDLGL